MRSSWGKNEHAGTKTGCEKKCHFKFDACCNYVSKVPFQNAPSLRHFPCLFTELFSGGKNEMFRLLPKRGD